MALHDSAFAPNGLPLNRREVLTLSGWVMACPFVFEPLARFVAGGAEARPDHPINGR